MSISLPAAYSDFLRTGATLSTRALINVPIILTPIPEAELTLDAVWVQVDETDLREDDPHDCEGAYRVEIVSLVRCDTTFDQGYGILVWVPGEGCFGAYDTEHSGLYLFRDTPWEAIRANIDTYIGILGGVESPHVTPSHPGTGTRGRRGRRSRRRRVRRPPTLEVGVKSATRRKSLRDIVGEAQAV